MSKQWWQSGDNENEPNQEEEEEKADEPTKEQSNEPTEEQADEPEEDQFKDPFMDQFDESEQNQSDEPKEDQFIDPLMDPVDESEQEEEQADEITEDTFMDDGYTVEDKDASESEQKEEMTWIYGNAKSFELFEDAKLNEAQKWVLQKYEDLQSTLSEDLKESHPDISEPEKRIGCFIQAGMGSGKTLMLLKLAMDRFAENPHSGGGVLFLTHTQQLISQAKRQLEMYFPHFPHSSRVIEWIPAKGKQAAGFQRLDNRHLPFVAFALYSQLNAVYMKWIKLNVCSKTKTKRTKSIRTDEGKIQHLRKKDSEVKAREELGKPHHYGSLNAVFKTGKFRMLLLDESKAVLSGPHTDIFHMLKLLTHGIIPTLAMREQIVKVNGAAWNDVFTLHNSFVKAVGEFDYDNEKLYRKVPNCGTPSATVILSSGGSTTKNGTPYELIPLGTMFPFNCMTEKASQGGEYNWHKLNFWLHEVLTQRMSKGLLSNLHTKFLPMFQLKPPLLPSACNIPYKLRFRTVEFNEDQYRVLRFVRDYFLVTAKAVGNRTSRALALVAMMILMAVCSSGSVILRRLHRKRVLEEQKKNSRKRKRGDDLDEYEPEEELEEEDFEDNAEVVPMDDLKDDEEADPAIVKQIQEAGQFTKTTNSILAAIVKKNRELVKAGQPKIMLAGNDLVPPKVEETIRIIRETMPNQGENGKYGKIIVFAQSVELLEQLRRQLIKEGIYTEEQILKLYGSHLRKVRSTASFLLPIGDPNGTEIVLGTFLAASTGHDLFAANRTIMMELPWTPEALAQAAARSRRTGQKKDKVYLWVLLNSFTDLWILSILDTKFSQCAKLNDDSFNSVTAADAADDDGTGRLSVDNIRNLYALLKRKKDTNEEEAQNDDFNLTNNHTPMHKAILKEFIEKAERITLQDIETIVKQYKTNSDDEQDDPIEDDFVSD